MRDRIRLNGGSGWFVVGILVAAVISPAATVAAASFIRIQGSSGKVADVTGAGQLKVAVSDPRSFIVTGYPETDAPNCVVLDARPTSKGMVVQQLRVTVFQSPSFDRSHGLILFTGRDCSGAADFVFIPTGIGSYTETFEPGILIKAGGGVSIKAFGTGLQAESEITGYSIPAAAAP